ncbi:SAV_915 family protein [Streptacidiphilus albus]|uniref:SAV_915 family protein n=1 Tax=Streptacidiphilus albus TaxID=105425 RepID=UPI00054BDE10|nr:SAV_915 family protein [Streptacidiphilus albus]
MEPRLGPTARLIPDGRLFVPVRPRRGGRLLRLFQTPLGGRTVVGFTSQARLATALGEDQAWVELAEPALRALAEPLGVSCLIIDPHLVARPVAADTAPLAPVRLELGALEALEA